MYNINQSLFSIPEHNENVTKQGIKDKMIQKCNCNSLVLILLGTILIIAACMYMCMYV